MTGFRVHLDDDRIMPYARGCPSASCPICDAMIDATGKSDVPDELEIYVERFMAGHSSNGENTRPLPLLMMAASPEDAGSSPAT